MTHDVHGGSITISFGSRTDQHLTQVLRALAERGNRVAAAVMAARAWRHSQQTHVYDLTLDQAGSVAVAMIEAREAIEHNCPLQDLKAWKAATRKIIRFVEVEESAAVMANNPGWV